MDYVLAAAAIIVGCVAFLSAVAFLLPHFLLPITYFFP